MSFKVTGAPGSGKVVSHIETKEKVNAATGRASSVVVETPVPDKKKEKEEEAEK